MRCNWQCRFEKGTHGVDLTFDRITGYSAFSPSLGHHGANPYVPICKQHYICFRLKTLLFHHLPGCIQRNTVQSEMSRAGDGETCEHGLKLRSRLQSLHYRAKPTQWVSKCDD